MNTGRASSRGALTDDNDKPSPSVLKAELLNIEQEIALSAGEDGVDVTDEAIVSSMRKHMPKAFTKKLGAHSAVVSALRHHHLSHDHGGCQARAARARRAANDG